MATIFPSYPLLLFYYNIIIIISQYDRCLKTFRFFGAVFFTLPLLHLKSDEGEKRRGYEIRFERGFSSCTMRAKS
jgi:hypothetical protein